ncbi:acyltransferase family protein [Prosthecobacter sp.]|uniref:acyltransferase family protein n=1 Tax=Prosthecobacter sp. TaxID=1965333 RepID=UPI00378386A9
MNKFLPGPGLLRFALALIVVVHHSFPLRMGSWAVYAFFILSGYWIARMWAEKYVQTRSACLTFICSRWCRLAPVFFVSLALAFVSSSVVPGAPPLPQNLLEWALRQLPILGSKSAGSILPPAWSLDVEMQFYLAFALLMFIGGFLRPRVVNWLVAVLAVASFAFLLLEAGVRVVENTSSLPLYFWLFAIGMAFYHLRWAPSRRTALVSASLFIAVTAGFLLWPATRGAIWFRGAAGAAQAHAAAWDPRLLVHLWWALGALVFAPFIAWNVLQKSDARDRMLGNWAYPLYLFHWIPRDAYYSVVNWSSFAWQNAFLLLANFAAALSGSWLIWKWIDQPLDRWRSRWVHSRLLPAQPDLSQPLLIPHPSS